MIDYVEKKGVRYFKEYNTARAIKNNLIKVWPESRVVEYKLGYAIQYIISGAYYPQYDYLDSFGE